MMTHQLRKKGARAVMFSFVTVLGLLVLWGWMATTTHASDEDHTLRPQSVPAPRHGHTLVWIGGDAYLFGGMVVTTTLANAPLNPLSAPSNDLWKMKGVQQIWEQVVPENTPPSPRAYHAAAASNGKMYVFFGNDGGTTPLSDIWTYDPTTNRWTQPTSQGEQPYARYSHSATTIANSIYIFGGTNGSNLLSPYVYKYDPSTGDWTVLDWLGVSPGPRYGHSGVSINNQLVVWGGYGGWSGSEEYRNDMWVCTQGPSGCVWKYVGLTASPAPSALHATAAYANTLWTFGGETTGAQQLDAVTQFQFPLSFTGTQTVTVSSQPSLPSSRVASAATVMIPGVVQASTPITEEVEILLFSGLSDGQTISETLILTYTVELPPRYTVYLPVIARSP